MSRTVDWRPKTSGLDPSVSFQPQPIADQCSEEIKGSSEISPCFLPNEHGKMYHVRQDFSLPRLSSEQLLDPQHFEVSLSLK